MSPIQDKLKPLIPEWSRPIIPGNATQGNLLITKTDFTLPPDSQELFKWVKMEDIIGVANIKIEFDNAELPTSAKLYKAKGHLDERGEWYYEWEQVGEWGTINRENAIKINEAKYSNYTIIVNDHQAILYGIKADGTQEQVGDIINYTTYDAGVQLRSDLTAEAQRATAEESRLDTKIDTETQRATAEEARLDNKIDTETQRATAEESRIETKLDNETARATAEESRIETKLDNEITRATAEETRLDNKIDTETQRATAEESRIETKLDNETARATAEESRIDTKLDNEITRATAEETRLDNKIDTETQRATGIENGLRLDITALQNNQQNIILPIINILRQATNPGLILAKSADGVGIEWLNKLSMEDVYATIDNITQTITFKKVVNGVTSDIITIDRVQLTTINNIIATLTPIADNLNEASTAGYVLTKTTATDYDWRSLSDYIEIRKNTNQQTQETTIGFYINNILQESFTYKNALIYQLGELDGNIKNRLDSTNAKVLFMTDKTTGEQYVLNLTNLTQYNFNSQQVVNDPTDGTYVISIDFTITNQNNQVYISNITKTKITSTLPMTEENIPIADNDFVLAVNGIK